jgi:hypothetical protein
VDNRARGGVSLAVRSSQHSSPVGLFPRDPPASYWGEGAGGPWDGWQTGSPGAAPWQRLGLCRYIVERYTCQSLFCGQGKRRAWIGRSFPKAYAIRESAIVRGIGF